MQDVWQSVDQYFSDHLVPVDPVLVTVLKRNSDEGLPAIDVAPNQGKLLNLIARIHGAKRILEIGTLGGYSSIWLARALPADGTMVSLELEPHHADVARTNLAEAGLEGVVEVRVGAAADSLNALHGEGVPPFDLIFIDADKASYPTYLEWSLKLSRPGTVIIGDNVVRNGAVVNPNTEDVNVKGVQTFMEKISAEPRLSGTAIQTVGSKGYDGFYIGIVAE